MKLLWKNFQKKENISQKALERNQLVKQSEFKIPILNPFIQSNSLKDNLPKDMETKNHLEKLSEFKIPTQNLFILLNFHKLNLNSKLESQIKIILNKKSELLMEEN